MYQQVLDPVADSLAWSAIVAALPLLLLFVLLGALTMTAWKASLISLGLADVRSYALPVAAITSSYRRRARISGDAVT